MTLTTNNTPTATPEDIAFRYRGYAVAGPQPGFGLYNIYDLEDFSPEAIRSHRHIENGDDYQDAINRIDAFYENELVGKHQELAGTDEFPNIAISKATLQRLLKESGIDGKTVTTYPIAPNHD